MKPLPIYYLVLVIFIGASQLFPQGRVLFPQPRVNALYFPSEEQVFSPSFPVLPPGSLPHFPEADIILQENLYAPFSVFYRMDLSNKNLAKAHLSFADLRDCNLRGTNLSGALLYGAALNGAIFNNRTRLPFSRSFALSLGMKEQL